MALRDTPIYDLHGELRYHLTDSVVCTYSTPAGTIGAHDCDVLVPWNSWRHEFYKPMGTFHDADCGGFIFAFAVGLHEDVHELDFSSLSPNIICTQNVSPDVIRCECYRDRDDVPGLGYVVCDERGYLVDVFQPIIEVHDEIKAAIRREQ